MSEALTVTGIAHDDELLLAQLSRDEGRVLHAYQDHLGFWTIGIGRLIDKRRGGGISAKEADYLCSNDVAEVLAGLDDKLPWWRSLDPPRQRVLANMAFNLGVAGLLKFRNTLAAVQRGDWPAARRGMLASLWARQVGTRAQRLAHTMLTGEDVRP